MPSYWCPTMPSRLSLIAALLLPLAVQAEPADTRALLADSQAQVEAAEQAMRRSENKAVQLYAKRVLTEQQEFDHQLRALAGEKALALPSPRQTERQAAAPGGFDERGFLDAQIRQQDRLVARFEGIARDSADPDLRRFADEWLARFYHHRELADQLRSGRAD
ncbi:hypothetical protein PDB1_01392 [Pseudomonas aeruginosa]